ncbi:MAG: molecular chaperone HtpG, partial [Clostridia bacterium]|nr:molecular chaperone HtpG [Clostridia bacterium]
GMQMPEKRTLTLNKKHSLVNYLMDKDASDETAKMIAEQIVDLAEMARKPLVAERMVAFLKRSTKILSLAIE